MINQIMLQVVVSWVIAYHQPLDLGKITDSFEHVAGWKSQLARDTSILSWWKTNLP